MNEEIKLAVTNHIMASKYFISTCKLSALKDDGVIDKLEQKQLDKIKKITEKYMKELERVIQ